MKDFTNDELLTVLRFTEALADATTPPTFADAKVTDSNRDSVLREAEEEARRYAAARNKGKRARSDYGATEVERNITAGVRAWLERQRKRGHKV